MLLSQFQFLFFSFYCRIVMWSSQASWFMIRSKNQIQKGVVQLREINKYEWMTFHFQSCSVLSTFCCDNETRFLRRIYQIGEWQLIILAMVQEGKVHRNKIKEHPEIKIMRKKLKRGKKLKENKKMTKTFKMEHCSI